MITTRNISFLVLSCTVALSGFSTAANAAMTAAEKAVKAAQIDNLRKSGATITVLDGTTPVPNLELQIKQIRHHFGFGAAIAKWPFDSAGAIYPETFKKYFEWATPENEMKWPEVQYEEGADNYVKGDFLVDWCHTNDIKVRGHNLFWNQSLNWVPEWMSSIAYEKDYAKGQQVVDERIQGAMTRYKGKCAHWDIINELIHGQVPTDTTDENSPQIGSLKALTGREDQDIFKYVLDECAKIDPETRFCLNDYNLVTQWSDRDAYITAVNNLISQNCKIDILGLEGHFGGNVDPTDLKAKIDDIATRIPDKEMWLTEVDFEAFENDRPARLEEILTTAFAHPRIGGVVLWVWWEGARWREALTSFLVDSSFAETNMGAKWRELLGGWTTSLTESTSAEGKVTFSGFQGKYVITMQKGGQPVTDTIYLNPGNAQNFTIPFDQLVSVDSPQRISRTGRTILLNGSTISFHLPASATGQLYISAYSLSGKLLERKPLSFADGISSALTMPAGCHIYSIGTDTQVFHTVRGLNIH
ncbi:MAG: endo-1,4-beta-xylanase [Chitinispirillaceae bacterium]|nr:endo-1,4-beta-xylanase [Chitinispirillaceae bacterium]